MPPYIYPSPALGSENIRLLRLLPSEDEAAPIECKLCIYPLQKLEKANHLYEALSYVWGGSEMHMSIFIEGSELPVTANLHNALSRLRDHYFERVLWVDSICINQRDQHEREGQIRLMGKIYSHANRVIVYLGEAADDSDQAFEDIRVAAEDESVENESPEDGPVKHEAVITSTDKKRHDAIYKVLKRPWFRRVWVLQEVGLARNILVKCGSSEINGHTFCSGINKLKLLYTGHPNLQNIINPVTHLIREAIFRPKYGKFSPAGVSIGTLVDMYRTHEATVRHDKVYALLGMSSDDIDEAALSPDYSIAWETVLRRLISYLLPNDLSFETWTDDGITVIKGRGYTLGHVLSAKTDSTGSSRQHIEVALRDSHESFKFERDYGTKWIVPASAKAIKEHDIICLLHGATKPTIIRARRDYFDIIMIAVALQKQGWFPNDPPLIMNKNFLRNFLLVWDWEGASSHSEANAEHDESPLEISNLVPEFSKTCLNEEARVYDVALVLGDSKTHREAENRLQKAIEDCEKAFGKEDLRTLTAKESLALISLGQKEIISGELKIWKKVRDSLLELIQTRKRVQGTDHSDTLNSIANLFSGYITRDISFQNEHNLVENILRQIRDDSHIPEKEMTQVVVSCSKNVIAALLKLAKTKITITNCVIETAAANESFDSERTVALLLDHRAPEVKFTTKMWEAAAGNGDNGASVLDVLFKYNDGELMVTEKTFEIAAANGVCGLEVTSELLYHCGNRVRIGENVLIQAVNNQSFGQRILALLFDKYEDEIEITEQTLKVAASDNYRGHELIQFFHQRPKTNFTTGVIEAAATAGQEKVLELFDDWGIMNGNSEHWFRIARLYNAAINGDSEVFGQLILQGTPVDKVNNQGRTPLFAASCGGKTEVIKLLLQTDTFDPNALDIYGHTVLYWAAAFGRCDAVQLLLDHGADPNLAGGDGHTPILQAAIHGHSQTVLMLLKYGANPNFIDKNGETAMSGARKRKFFEIVDILIGHPFTMQAKEEEDSQPKVKRLRQNSSGDWIKSGVEV